MVGGSFYSLLEIVRHLDRERYASHILFYDPNDLVEEFQSHHAVVHTLIDQAVTPTVTAASSNGRGDFAKALFWSLMERLGKKRFLQTALQQRRGKVFAQKAVGIIGQHGIDIVHINNGLNPALPFISALKRFHLPIIVHERKLRVYTAWEKRQQAAIAKIVCISNYVLQNIRRQIRSATQCCLVYNSVTPQDYTEQEKSRRLYKELGCLDDQVVLVQVSNLGRGKGQDTLVAAAHMLKQSGLRFKLFFVGGVLKGEEAYVERLHRLTREFNLDEYVTFCGFRKEKMAFLDIADIIVHVPSQPEAFGRVVLEGMQAGKAVIACDTGGPAEIVDDCQTGLLVPPQDPAALAKAIDQLMKNPTLRNNLGASAQKKALTMFSSAAMTDRIESIYEAV